MPSPSFVSHMIAGSNIKEDQELQKMEEIVEDLEELLDAIDEAVEETRNTDEESRDSIAQEIIDVVNEDRRIRAAHQLQFVPGVCPAQGAAITNDV